MRPLPSRRSMLVRRLLRYSPSPATLGVGISLLALSVSAVSLRMQTTIDRGLTMAIVGPAYPKRGAARTNAFEGEQLPIVRTVVVNHGERDAAIVWTNIDVVHRSHSPGGVYLSYATVDGSLNGRSPFVVKAGSTSVVDVSASRPLDPITYSAGETGMGGISAEGRGGFSLLLSVIATDDRADTYCTRWFVGDAVLMRSEPSDIAPVGVAIHSMPILPRRLNLLSTQHEDSAPSGYWDLRSGYDVSARRHGEYFNDHVDPLALFKAASGGWATDSSHANARCESGHQR